MQLLHQLLHRLVAGPRDSIVAQGRPGEVPQILCSAHVTISTRSPRQTVLFSVTILQFANAGRSRAALFKCVLRELTLSHCHKFQPDVHILSALQPK